MSMRNASKSKMVTFWEYDEGDERSRCCRNVSNKTKYSMITAGTLIVCGIITTLWVWSRYGVEGFHSGSASTTTAILLGPGLCLIGIVSVFTACIIHEVRERRRYDFLDPDNTLNINFIWTYLTDIHMIKRIVKRIRLVTRNITCGVGLGCVCVESDVC